MRRFILTIIITMLLVLPVYAMEFSAPEAPEAAEAYMPDQVSSFGSDLWYIVRSALHALQPQVAEAAQICLSILCVTVLISIVQSFAGTTKCVTELVGTIGIGLLLIQPTNTMIHLAAETVTELSSYGKLLIPVLAAALAAQGGTGASASLYFSTAVLDSILSAMVSAFLVPMIYIFLFLCIADSAMKVSALEEMKNFTKWLITWILKIILYIFTGYIGITGVVSGAADAAALKATKLTISGMVPVVGSILSDASEAVLVSAGVMKSAVGVYGLLSIVALLVGPFLKIGVQYLLLRITAAVSAVFGSKEMSALIEDFASALGLLLAMTGTVSLLLLISTVCFMRGVS